MKELLEVIAKNLVDNPDKVSVNSRMDEDALILELTVDGDDIGKVIGKQGRIAKAIRTIFKAIGAKEQKKITIEFID